MARPGRAASPQEVCYVPPLAPRRGRRPTGRRARDRPRPGRRAAAAAVLLLPVLLLPPQLLAVQQPAVAGAARLPVPAAAGLHGLPAVQGIPLALHALRVAPLLQRQPLLAR